MDDEISVCEYDESYRSSCTDLLKRTFPLSRIRDIITWKSQGTSSNPPLLTIARKGSRVISFLSWFPWEFSYRSQRFTGYQAGDAATDPAFRRIGIWHRVIYFSLDLMKKRNVDFLFGFPNRKIVQGGFRTDFLPVSTFAYRIRPVLPYIRSISRPAHSENNCYTPFYLSQPDKITPLANDMYSQWRYADDCNLIEYSESNCQARFYVRRKRWKIFHEALLLDCQFTSLDQTFINNAFRHLDNAFSGRALFIRTFFNEDSDRGQLLKRFFPFSVSSKSRRFLVKSVSDRMPLSVLLNRLSWDIMPHCVDDL